MNHPVIAGLIASTVFVGAFMFNKNDIYNYIERGHLEDGGYFFARIPPASGLDTYLAVKTLKILGLSPKEPAKIINFWQNEEHNGNIDDLNGLFYAIQTYKELGYPFQHFKKYRKALSSIYRGQEWYQKNPIYLRKKKINLANEDIATLYTDIVESEAKSALYLTVLTNDLGVTIDQKRLINYVESLQNDDGGFGSIKESELSTTYYCLRILNLIGYPFPREKEIEQFLVEQFQAANYLEQYYWTIEGLVLLKREIPDKNLILAFLVASYCWNGGFARSQFIGIPTIEYTYYAVSILKYLEKQHIPLFNNKL